MAYPIYVHMDGGIFRGCIIFVVFKVRIQPSNMRSDEAAQSMVGVASTIY